MTSKYAQALQVRAAIDRLATNVNSDSEYAKRIKNDPVGVMLEEGLPPESVVQILQEEGYSNEDVTGFAANFPGLNPSLLSSTRGGGGLAWCPCTACCCSNGCCITYF